LSFDIKHVKKIITLVNFYVVIIILIQNLKKKIKLIKKDSMGKQYAREPAVAKKSAKAKASDLRTHFKNTYEVAKALKG